MPLASQARRTVNKSKQGLVLFLFTVEVFSNLRADKILKTNAQVIRMLILFVHISITSRVLVLYSVTEATVLTLIN